MTRYRVSCRSFTTPPVRTMGAAERRLVEIERVGTCLLLHTVEVEQESGEWLPLHQHRARLILAAPLNQVIESVNGPLTKSGGGWSREAGERADAAGEPGSEAWWAALGPHEHATLTQDGGPAEPSAWCSHKTPADAWVRYERWSPRGCEAHGYVCPREDCRRLVQSG
jgi:hypothetical protein